VEVDLSDWVLLLHQEDSDASAPVDHAALAANFFAWTDGLRRAGKLIAVERLGTDFGKTVRKRGGEVVVDGPFTEGKEGVVGLFVVRATSFDEAVTIARTCPLVAVGGSVEVRRGEPVDG
jgi:hypothetical protein